MPYRNEISKGYGSIVDCEKMIDAIINVITPVCSLCICRAAQYNWQISVGKPYSVTTQMHPSLEEALGETFVLLRITPYKVQEK